MVHYAIKSSTYQTLIKSACFYGKSKFLIYKYHNEYYLNTHKYLNLNNILINTGYMSYLLETTFLGVNEFDIMELSYTDISDNIYISKDETLVKEFCGRSIVFDDIYLDKCIDNIDNLYNYIDLLLDFKKGGFKYSRLTVAQLYDLFKLEAIWFLLMFYDDGLREEYYVCKEVEKLPLYSIHFSHKDIFDYIIKQSMRYTVYGIESKYKFGIKDKTMYDKTLKKLQKFLFDYKFFNCKLGLAKDPLDDIHYQYVKGLFFKKDGGAINFADSYFLYDKLKGFNDSKQNYSKFIDDNEIIVIADEDIDKYNDYYIVKKDDYYIWNSILPMSKLLEIKEKLDDNINNLTQEEYLYMYLYLLLLTPIDENIDMKFMDLEFNMLTENHLLDDLFE